jgi:hypothetical protein
LSDKQQGESHKADIKEASGKGAAGKKDRGKRTTDVGRALRSVYDDTLRENVPDDFMDLLGKLS